MKRPFLIAAAVLLMALPAALSADGLQITGMQGLGDTRYHAST